MKQNHNRRNILDWKIDMKQSSGKCIMCEKILEQKIRVKNSRGKTDGKNGNL